MHNGRPLSWRRSPGPTFALGPSTEVPAAEEMLGAVQSEGDALIRLNDAFVPDAVFVDVPADTRLDAPVLVVHWCDGEGVAAFTRLCVRAGAGAAVSVVEVFTGPAAAGRSLVVPVTELLAQDNAEVAYVSLQTLPDDDWSLARLAARGGAKSSLRTFTVGLVPPTAACGPT